MSVFQLAERWAGGARNLLELAQTKVAEFDRRVDQASRAIDGLTKTAGTCEALVNGLEWTGAASAEREFGRRAHARLALAQFRDMSSLYEIGRAFGVPDNTKPFHDRYALFSERDQLLRDVSSLAASVDVKDLQAVLEGVRQAPDPEPSAPKRTPSLYTPKDKRPGRWKAARWTVGILFVVALVSRNFLYWLLFLGAIGFVVAVAAITSNFDEELEQARLRSRQTGANLKRDIADLDSRARRLVSLLQADLKERLAGFSRTANAAAAAAGSSKSETYELGDRCELELSVDHVSSALQRWLDKRLVAGDAAFENDPIAECDEVKIIVDEGEDSAGVGRALARAAMAATRPGFGRFMFVEPGRLAEAYRVFGALNDTPATRLGERLYVTHVSELGEAVDTLRTFVGRTKEAMTREAGQRLTDRDAGERELVLQRAVVVLDRTEVSYWPDKDRRRLAEYYDEIQSLAQVGAREGSVLLISLERPEGLSRGVTESEVRAVKLLAGSSHEQPVGVSLCYLAADEAREVAAACDGWAQAAKKADAVLPQKNAKLDWSDSEASDTRYGVEVEIGRHGAGRPARLVLGRDGAHHAISIGRTGSGKTNLFHVIISNMVRRYSPEELELYLLDFKEGVEFSVYADLALPHCRAVAIDADRAFGLSVLTHLRRELNRRANVLKASGVGITSLEKYEETTGKNMPRIVLLIDEFQVLLQGEKMAGAPSGAAAAALEDIVRRGRSFGVHVILGSQTLAGRELTPATLGQLAVRIVLPCSAPDAVMLLGDQTVSSQLRAPGDAIVWSAGQGEVSDSHLAKIFGANLKDLPELAETSRAHMIEVGTQPPAPFVFRGSGQNDLAEVMPHLKAASAELRDKSGALFAVGAPTAYGDRPAGIFESRRCRNLLFVHRTDETRTSFFFSALESMLSLNSDCRVIVCDLDQVRGFSAIAETLAAAFGDRVQLVSSGDLETALTRLLSQKEKVRTIVAIAGAGRGNLVRAPAFAKVLSEGPEKDVHVLATCDSVRNLERVIDRSALAEFGMRALGPATAAESQRLLDSNDAETLSAEHQYLVWDDTTAGRLERLQVLVSRAERGEECEPEPELSLA